MAQRGGDPEPPLGRRTMLTIAVVPVVMLLVAGVGAWRFHEHRQTAWRGATMGMFAQVDAPPNRLVRGIVAGEPGAGGVRRVELPPRAVADEREGAAVAPDAANLRSLAEQWAPLVERGSLVRVEVWASRFRHDGLAFLELELVGSLDLGGAGSETASQDRGRT